MSKVLKEPIYEQLRDRLRSGDFEPGQRIAEQTLARELGVSRGPVREAIHQLAGQELVDLIPGLGAFPKEPTLAELEDIYDLREAIETHAVARAAKRIDGRELRKLDQINQRTGQVLREMKDADTHVPDKAQAQRLREADEQFHQTILNASGNERMSRMVRDLELLTLAWSRRLDPAVFDVWSEHVQAYTCHRRVTAALRQGDARAARRWMRYHIRTTIQRYRKQAARRRR